MSTHRSIQYTSYTPTLLTVLSFYLEVNEVGKYRFQYLAKERFLFMIDTYLSQPIKEYHEEFNNLKKVVENQKAGYDSDLHDLVRSSFVRRN